MLKAHRYSIYPANVQQWMLQRQFGAVRFVFNYFLAEQQDRYAQNKPHLSFFDLGRKLLALK